VVRGKAIVLNSVASFWHMRVAELLDTLFAVDSPYNRRKI